MAESLHISSGTGGLPKLLNNCQTLTFNLFTARSSLLLYAFVWAPYICMEKMLIISNGFSSEASRPVLLKFHAEPPCLENERLLKWVWSIDQNGCHAHIW